MKVLLDTHVWIGWLHGSARLPLAERRALDRSAGSGGCHLSAMSLWEAQRLHAKGRLVLDRPFPNWLREAAAPGVVSLLPLDVAVVVALDSLPGGFHGDPADRLIVASSQPGQRRGVDLEGIRLRRRSSAPCPRHPGGLGGGARGA